VVLRVQTERRCPTAVRVSGSGLPPPTMRHKTDHYYNKDFYLHIYNLSLHLLEHWRVSSVLALDWGPRPAPWPRAGEAGGWWLQAS